MKKIACAALLSFLICAFVFIPSCGNPQLTDTTTVYWTPAGAVYHISANCYELKRSSDIESGTIEQARGAGKSRVCRVCGKNYKDVDSE